MSALKANVRDGVTQVITRDTQDGRRIEYHLKVIQQPERARACGSGAKSSADRRPVDPPPVVRLLIKQQNGTDKPDDITFSYSANFFLFATLELSRPIHHGRVQQSAASQQQVPVLTGMPVSGMAYLDRPEEAGYFIFPDLSVRHEGLYKLSFNLYEETRDARDADAEPQGDKSRVVAGAPDSSFDWRMEVKSDEFTVFSAKKFPGLAESTNLSRTVAEQGCRVRIRRDVRMRRREGKNGGDYDDVAEESYEQKQRGRASEQDLERERSRSISGGTAGDRAAFEAGRHHEQYPRSYSNSPVAPNASVPPGGHLAFLGGQTNQYPAPPQPAFAPPQVPAPQSSYQPPQAPYPSQYRPAPPAPSAQPSYSYDRQYPQSAYPSNPPREQREFEPEYRRASVASYTPQHNMYPAVDSNYSRPPYPGFAPPSNERPTLPALKMHPNRAPSPAPLSAVKTAAPPLPSPTFERSQESAPSFSNYSAPIPAIDPVPEPARHGKRPFGAAFSSQASIKPLFDGMRPSSSHGPDNEEDNEEEKSTMMMQYKRADGGLNRRQAPLLSG